MSPSTTSIGSRPEPENPLSCTMLSSASDVKIEESRLNSVAGNMIVVTINSSPSNHQGSQLRGSQNVPPLCSPRNIKVEDSDIKFEDSVEFEHDTKADDDDSSSSSSSSRQGRRGHVRFLSTSNAYSDSGLSPDVKSENSTITGFNIKNEGSIRDIKPSVNLCHSTSETKPDVDAVSFFPFDMEETLPRYHTHATCTIAQITPKMSISRMYSRLMFIHELGYPLYVPRPNDSSKAHLKEYRKKGIRIGDVGIITDNGSFDFLFNACYPADHPVNPDVLPDCFDPLITVDDLVVENFEAETFLLSNNVKQTNDSPITYQCPGPEGAVLALPNGSTVFEARNLEDFRNHAARYAVSWYEYLKKTRGRTTPNGALYFVTACIKSNSWGIAAFYPGETDGNSIQFVSDGDSYKWVKSGRIIARMGPRSQGSTSTADEELNQCTFLTGYKIMLREDLWEGLKTKVSVLAAEDQPSKGRTNSEGTHNGSGGCSNANGAGNLAKNGGAGNSSPAPNRCLDGSDVVIDGDLVTSLPQYHPSDFINIALLESDPRARVALVHDIQWKGGLPEHFTVDPSDKQIVQMLWNVTQSYDTVLDKFDCIYLVRKDTVEGNPSSTDTDSELEADNCPSASETAGISPIATIAPLMTAGNRKQPKLAKFLCSFEGCKATYITRHNLQYHINSHLGVKPYKCSLCTYAAASPATLTRHRKGCQTKTERGGEKKKKKKKIQLPPLYTDFPPPPEHWSPPPLEVPSSLDPWSLPSEVPSSLHVWPWPWEMPWLPHSYVQQPPLSEEPMDVSLD